MDGQKINSRSDISVEKPIEYRQNHSEGTKKEYILQPQPLVISSKHGFFQPLPIDPKKLAKPVENPHPLHILYNVDQPKFEDEMFQPIVDSESAFYDPNNKNLSVLDPGMFNKSVNAAIKKPEEEFEEYELTFVTKEEITIKCCNNASESKQALLTWGEKYSTSNDVLLVYQENAMEWFICSKNSEECVTNEKISSLSVLGKWLQSKNLEEIASINSEDALDKALDYLGYEEDSATEHSSTDAGDAKSVLSTLDAGMFNNSVSDATKKLEDEFEECELSFDTSEEIIIKSCADSAESKCALLAWEKKYSASNDVLFVYQQDAKAWFICGKNSEYGITHEKVSSTSALGKMLQSKNREEIARIHSEDVLEKALAYLGYEDISAEDDVSADGGLLKISL